MGDLRGQVGHCWLISMCSWKEAAITSVNKGSPLLDWINNSADIEVADNVVQDKSQASSTPAFLAN